MQSCHRDSTHQADGALELHILPLLRLFRRRVAIVKQPRMLLPAVAIVSITGGCLPATAIGGASNGCFFAVAGSQ